MRYRYIAKVLMAACCVAVLSGCGAPAVPPKAGASVGVAGTIAISEPRLRVPAVGQTQTAAYLTLTNTGTANDRLIRATSPLAQNLELHAHFKSADGMMAMRKLTYIDVPAGTSIALVPGGLHIMVKQVKQDLKVGETVPVELVFASGATAALMLPVVANPQVENDPTPEKAGHQH